MNGEQVWMLVAMAEAVLLIVVPTVMAGRAHDRRLKAYDQGCIDGAAQYVRDTRQRQHQ